MRRDPTAARRDMSENGSTGYSESADTADADENLIDGRTGDNAGDGGERDTEGNSDTVLLTDDEAQRDDDVLRPGNSAG
jgi:hypothetical protein